MIRLMFGDNTKGEIVNIGSPEEHTVLEFATIVKELVGSQSKIVFSEKLPEDDPKMRKADIQKAKALLGWEPHVTLEVGLEKMIEYFKTNT